MVPDRLALQIDLGIMRNHFKMADRWAMHRRLQKPATGTAFAPSPHRKFWPHRAGGCLNRWCIAGRSGIRFGSHRCCWVEVVSSAFRNAASHHFSGSHLTQRLRGDCLLGLCRLRRQWHFSDCAAPGGEGCAGTFLSSQSAWFVPSVSDCSQAQPQRSEFATIAVERRVWPVLIARTSKQRGLFFCCRGCSGCAVSADEKGGGMRPLLGAIAS